MFCALLTVRHSVYLIMIHMNSVLDSAVKTVAVCAGSGSSVLNDVRADLYITGEMGHHDVLHATQTGTSVILCEHTNTERGYLKLLCGKLRLMFGLEMAVVMSEADVEPLVITWRWSEMEIAHTIIVVFCYERHRTPPPWFCVTFAQLNLMGTTLPKHLQLLWRLWHICTREHWQKKPSICCLIITIYQAALTTIVAYLYQGSSAKEIVDVSCLQHWIRA